MEAETLTCSECGAENSSDADACLACGSDIVAGSGPLGKIPTPALLGGVALILLIVLGVLAKTLYTKSRPSSHTNAGLSYLDAGDHANAKKEFKAALKFDGRYEGAIIGMARVGAETDDEAINKKFAKLAIAALDKGSLRAKIRVAYAWNLLKNDKFREANNQAIEALEDDDSVAGADALRGISALRMSPPQEDDAILYLKKAAGQESKRPQVYSALSKLLLKREDFEGGEGITKQGLALTKDDAELWLLLASHRRGRKNEKGERKALESALKIDDSRADIHTQLSRVCLELEDPQGALVHAKKAAQIAPDDQGAQLALGRILLVNGKPRNARKALEKAGQGNWEVDYLLGKALTQASQAADKTKGVRRMIKALKGREKEHPELVEETAKISVAGGSREAASFLRDQVRGFPDSYDLNYLYAKILASGRNAKSKEREIKKHVKACLNLNPRRKEAPFLLGNFLLELGRIPDAIAAWDLGLKSNEDDPDLLRAKGKAALRANLWDAAIDAFQRLVKLDSSDSDAKADLKSAQDGKFFDGQ
ncbi:MAG: tetratricopeptide repeat protein [Planctomycetes bacterium]|nr:tetratricopeptide repeat protein [Planctomycetota bacterium]